MTPMHPDQDKDWQEYQRLVQSHKAGQDQIRREAQQEILDALKGIRKEAVKGRKNKQAWHFEFPYSSGWKNCREAMIKLIEDKMKE